MPEPAAPPSFPIFPLVRAPTELAPSPGAHLRQRPGSLAPAVGCVLLFACVIGGENRSGVPVADLAPATAARDPAGPPKRSGVPPAASNPLRTKTEELWFGSCHVDGRLRRAWPSTSWTPCNLPDHPLDGDRGCPCPGLDANPTIGRRRRMPVTRATRADTINRAAQPRHWRFYQKPLDFGRPTDPSTKTGLQMEARAVGVGHSDHARLRLAPLRLDSSHRSWAGYRMGAPTIIPLH